MVGNGVPSTTHMLPGNWRQTGVASETEGWKMKAPAIKAPKNRAEVEMFLLVMVSLTFIRRG